MGQADDRGRGRHSATPPDATPVPEEQPAPDLPHAPAQPPADQPSGPTAVPGRHRASGSVDQASQTSQARRASQASRADRVRRGGRWPLAALVVLAVAVVVAVVVAVTTSSGGTGPSAAAASTAARDLAAWGTAQLPPGATLSADTAAAGELSDAGVDTGALTTAAAVTGGAAGPALLVVAGAAAGRTVVAHFPGGSGGGLTVVDPAAVPPSTAQLDQRRQLGEALLANPLTDAPDAVARRLRAGSVDPRLLTLLAGMAAQFGIQLAALPTVAGEPTTAPARVAVVGAVDGRPVSEGSAELAELRTYLGAQLATFSPDDVQLVDGGLQLGFRYVTDPDGAVTRGGG